MNRINRVGKHIQEATNRITKQQTRNKYNIQRINRIQQQQQQQYKIQQQYNTRFYGTSYRRVYAWGVNTNGNLGLNKTKKELMEQTKPRAINPKSFGDKKVIKVVTGPQSQHAFAITEDGSLYGWGNNMNYQLGTGDVDNALGPIQIEIPPVVDVATGGTYSAAITEDGSVYTWGSNTQALTFWQAKQAGPLGVVKTGVIKTPQRLPKFTDATPIKISCGKRHMGVVTSNHEVYLWGQGTWGRLGNGGNASAAYPQILDFDFEGDVEEISCGAKHTHFLTSDKKIYSCGKNEQKQLGTEESTAGLAGGSNFDMKTRPTKIDIPQNIREKYEEQEIALENVQASSRWGAAIITNGEGELLRWGSPQNAPMIMELPTAVKQYAIGKNHGVYVSPQNELFNLGKPSSSMISLEPKKTSIILPGDIISVTAGNNMTFALVQHDSDEQTSIPNQE